MSAWKFMSATARRDAVLAGRRKLLDADEIADKYGATVQAVERIIAGLRDTDEGSGTPREPAACDAAPTPATPSTPGAGGPDGGSSPVAGATSSGGGDAAAQGEARAAQTSPPPQIRAKKSTRVEKQMRSPPPPRQARAGKLAWAAQKVMKPAPDVPDVPETPRASRQGETMLSVWFPQETLVALRARAKKMGMTRAEAAAHLLKGVLKDGKSA